MLSKYDVDDEENFGKVFAVRVPFAVSSQSSWVWVNALHKHINAREIFCLDSQTTSAIYDNSHDSSRSSERYPLLRMLATSSVVSDAEGKGAYPVRTLEIPRFTTGIPAALLTLVCAATGSHFDRYWNEVSSCLCDCATAVSAGRGEEAARARAVDDLRVHNRCV